MIPTPETPPFVVERPPVQAPAAHIAVIGAGPAGLMAADRLAGLGFRVTLFEKMPSPARKFLMAGRGGLNLTHSEPLEHFLSRYGRAAPLLDAAIRAFPPEALRAFALELGEPTFIGSSGRVFPESFKTSPLLRAWLRRLGVLGVELRTRHEWRGWAASGALTFETPEGPREVAADATLLALGGASWPRLGGNGDWAGLLAGRGTQIIPFAPANMGLEIAWSAPFRDRFAGEPLKRIALSCAGAGPVRGEAVVTMRGLEGGAVYALSGAVRERIAAEGTAHLRLDLRPDFDQELIARRLATGPVKQSLSNRLRKAVGLPPVAVGLLREAAGVALPTDPAALARLIKAAPIKVHAVAGLDRAISSAGGVPFEALDAHFMLRASPGTFACGEMLDWEAPTGGYLLQASFATGRAAADGIAAYLAEQAQPVKPPAAR
ncbi:TIGR03862 family flavoprotein [Xanthobacter sp. DSM 24535]|uniref:NAD(P)/FAD-dependent oxidoreductase n=1 Tax=Roseixanthobacter psychrophilus TaxID=3119917 RepID=UPI00372690DA